MVMILLRKIFRVIKEHQNSSINFIIAQTNNYSFIKTDWKYDIIIRNKY
jgi:hypothetical protein